MRLLHEFIRQHSPSASPLVKPPEASTVHNNQQEKKKTVGATAQNVSYFLQWSVLDDTVPQISYTTTEA